MFLDAQTSPLPNAVAKHASPTSRWLIVGVALLLLILLFGRSMLRPLDLDEHQFVAPGVLLSEEGLLPYRDYPYFHMPHLVFVCAAVAKWMPYKLLAARLISIFCGWVALLLLWRCGWKALENQSPRLRWLLVGGILVAYMSSQLFVYANGLAWNHDSAILCALGAYLLFVRGLRTRAITFIALAGLLAGLAIGIRLSFALMVVPMGAGIWLLGSSWTWRGRALAFAVAVAATTIALLPAWILWIQNPDDFIFGNLKYPALSTGFYARIGASMTVWGKFAYLLRKMFSDPGNFFLYVFGAYALGFAFWRQRAWRSRFANELILLVGLMPVLTIGAGGPNPLQQQYFYMTLPFLVLAGFYVLALECERPNRLRFWRRAIFWGALVPAVVAVPRWYWPVIYLPDVNQWTPMQVHEAGQWLHHSCSAKARIITADPIFLDEGGLPSYQDYTVGRFPLEMGKVMTATDRHRFHILYGEELDRVLAEQPPDAVFVHIKGPHQALVDYARSHNFRKFDYHIEYPVAFTAADEFELWVRE